MMMKFFIFLFCGTEVAALKSTHTYEKRVESGDGAPTIFGVVEDKFHQESSRVFRQNLNNLSKIDFKKFIRNFKK